MLIASKSMTGLLSDLFKDLSTTKPRITEGSSFVVLSFMALLMRSKNLVFISSWPRLRLSTRSKSLLGISEFYALISESFIVAIKKFMKRIIRVRRRKAANILPNSLFEVGSSSMGLILTLPKTNVS